MFEWSPLSLGVSLAGIGFALWIVARILIRSAVQVIPTPPAVKPIYRPVKQGHQDAILLVYDGGKLAWLNPKAKELFRIPAHEVPNLERLARAARPGEAFLDLCAGETRASFVLSGKLVEGVSYWLPEESQPVMVVTLHYAGVNAPMEGGGENSLASLQTIANISREMTEKLGLLDTLQAVMESFEKLIAVDYLKICLWEKNGEVLIPYVFSGFVEGERRVEQLYDRYLPGEGNAGFLVKTKQPRFYSIISENTDLKPIPLVSDRRIRSYIGVPLLYQGSVIGSLEVGSLQEGQFKQSDLELIRLLSGQAAVAIHKGQQYDLQKRRADELSSLVDLSRALSSMREPKEVFLRLLENISPLIDVNILGFLIFNENDRLLAAQVPFKGIPENVAKIYNVQIAANSGIEKALLDQDVLYSDDAMTDSRWEELGLDIIARAASMRETVLIPLLTGGRVLGYLQAANHRESSFPFKNDELHLLTIIANQVAPVIENSALVQQTRLRAQRAEGLRRIASLASSDATLDEVLSFSVRELTNLIHPDVAGIFLVDKRREALTFHSASYFGKLLNLPVLLKEDKSIQLMDVQFPFTVTGSQHVINSSDLQEEKILIPFYRRVIESLGLRSAVVVPLVVRNDGVGEIWLGSREPGFFNKGDLQVVVTAAGQLASVVEQSYLVEQTDENLRRRVEQISAIDRINRELSASYELTSLMQTVLKEVIRATTADCGTLMVFDLQKLDGDIPTLLLHVGESHPKSFFPVELETLVNKQPALLSEISSELIGQVHEGVASLLLVPIMQMQVPAGLIVLHGKQPNKFDQTSLEIAQSLAVQASVVLRGMSLRVSAEEGSWEYVSDQQVLSRLPGFTGSVKRVQTSEEMIETLVNEIREITPFQMVLVSQYDPESRQLKRVYSCGLPEAAWQELKERTQPWRSIQEVLKPQYRHGNAYFIPYEGDLETAEDLHTVTPLPVMEQRMMGRWHAEDMLLVPVFDLRGKPLGLISLDSPRDGKRPGRPVFDALNLVAFQAAYLFERGIESQTDSSADISAAGLPPAKESQTLLDRLQETADKVSRQADLKTALQVAALDLMDELQMDAAFTALRDVGGMRILESLGNIPEGVSVEALFGQKNPLRQTLQENDFLFETGIDPDSAWQKTPLLRSLKSVSFISLPFQVSADTRAGILVLGTSPQQEMVIQDRSHYSRFSRQVSIGLQNLYLMTETRRRLEELHLLLEFTKKISNLDPQTILQTLVTSAIQAIPGAKAGWTAVWKEDAGWLQPVAADGYRDTASLLKIRYSIPDQTEFQETTRLPLPLRVYLSKKVRNADEVDFSRDYHLSAEHLLNYRQATGGPVPLSCLAAPLSIGDKLLGVIILDNFEISSAFSPADETMLHSFAQQAALALENARLFISTEQRAAQLQSLTHVAGVLSSSLHSEKLIGSILDLLGEVVPYDTATLWLRVEDQLLVSADRGFDDEESRVGISVAMEDSQLFQAMLSNQLPLVIGDVRRDDRFHALIEPDKLSWMGVPLLIKSELMGVIALEKRETRFYQPEHIHSAQTIASQAAVALENAKLFEESLQRTADLDERTQRLALLNRFSSELGSQLQREFIYDLTLKQIGEALQVDKTCVVELADDRAEILLERPAKPHRKPILLPQCQLLLHLRQSAGVYNHNQIDSEKELLELYQSYFSKQKIQSLLMVPLLAGDRFFGWVWAMRRDHYRFNMAELELARTICNQAAISLQNAQLFEETRNFSKTLEEKVRERTEELYREHLNTETMLRLSEELSRSLDISEVINRALAVMNESIGARQCLAVRTQNPARFFSIGDHLIQWDGMRPKQTSLIEELVYMDVNLEGKTLHIDKMDQELSRRGLKGDMPYKYQSLLALPLRLGSETLGVMMLAHEQAGYFQIDQTKLLEAGARQISIALNNMSFVEYIREAAEDQGRMLREQQIESNRSKAILEGVADGVLVTDGNNQISLMNKSAQEIFEISAEDYSGKPINSLSGLIGHEEAEKNWMATLQSWSSHANTYKGETLAERVMLDNGRYLAVHAAPVYFMGGFLGTVSVFRDVTHEVQIDRMKTEFIANVSHELRTPITSIKGYVQVLLMGAAGELNPQQRHFLDIVSSNTSRLTVLVNDLLDISRIETSRLSLLYQPVNLADLAADVVADVLKRSQDEEKPMNIRLEVSTSIPEVSGDQARLRQVLHSLLTNAYNYTSAGGEVLVTIAPVESMVQVDVKDNGIGIPPAEKSRIFERFYRGDDPMVLATSGTGLGLAIAKTLIEMHNGKIWFESSGIRGEGTTFSFSLPATSIEEK